MPQEVVYDQDRLFLVNENLGELMLTERFRSYVSQRCFKTYFCRAADPQSKGKVENMVKYVKRNFLASRSFKDLETLNLKLMAGFHVPPMPLRMGRPKEYLQGNGRRGDLPGSMASRVNGRTVLYSIHSPQGQYH